MKNESNLFEKTEAYLNSSNTNSKLTTMQLNITNKCNLSCKHCHIQDSPVNNIMMQKEIMDTCLDFFLENNFVTLDITGGAPELNPNLLYLLERASKNNIHTLLRTNLCILDTENYKNYIDKYKKYNVEIIGSLPSYLEIETDRIRGKNTFKSCINILKKLNELGYGYDNKLKLNLSYNPNGAFLVSNPKDIENDFKFQLKKKYNINFNNLYTIINSPIGKFKEFLIKKDNYNSYISKLINMYNSSNFENIMCKTQISVDCYGNIYNCDFNLALNLKTGLNILQLENKKISPLKIICGNHCFACTAGCGSSCTGSLNK